METTLIVMAAGIGSRFGTGIKQLAEINRHTDGTRGEIIIDYSVYDAAEAGFDHIVFIIRRDIDAEFREVIGDRITQALAERGVTVDYVYQELTDIPAPFKVPEGRTKPWGTGQAVLACKDLVKTPFVIINADDYYGKTAFAELHDWLLKNRNEPGRFTMAMAGFVLKNTVSPHGTVTRGICVADGGRMLTNVLETTGIAVQDGRVLSDRPEREISPDCWASMNMWAAYPEFLDHLDAGFRTFLGNTSGDPMKREYLIPMIVDGLLEEGRASVEILPTPDKWIGVTYKEDLEPAREDFREMVEAGVYPERLWER